MSDEKNKNLTQCNTCSGKISKKAKVCPHCGQRKPTTIYKKSPGGLIMIAILFIFLCMGFNSILTMPHSASHNIKPSISESAAREMCQEAIRARINNPSSLKIHYITGYGANVAATQILITQTFSSKNSFGLEKTYDAYCKLMHDGKFDFNVVEKGQ